MSILILNRSPLARTPYDQILQGAPGPLVVLSDGDRMRRFGESPADFGSRYAAVEAFSNYDLNGAVQLRALQLNERYRFSHVVTTWEFDMLRAAQLREHLGLPGQSVESAIVYRDKVVMKDAARAAGIAVTPYRALHSALDLIGFVAEHGLPAVVKPRNGGASIGVRILRSQADLEALLAEGLSPSMEAIPDLMVEKYVDALMYHVDGLVLDGKLLVSWPSLYFNDSLSYAEDLALGSAMLDPGHPLRTRLQDFVRTIVESFPTPRAMTFHAEVFHTADDGLLLCEIASRTGGGRINDAMRHAFGIGITPSWLRALCGLPVDVPPALHDPAVLPTQPFGWLSIPPQHGARFAYPPVMPFEWALDPVYMIAPDQVLDAATDNADHIASYVVRGDSEAQVRERLATLQTWVYDHFVKANGRVPGEALASL